MKRLIPFLVLALGLASLNALGDKAADRKEKPLSPSSIEGIWQVTKITAAAEEPPGFVEAPPGVAGSLKISFKDDKMTFIPAEPGYARYSYSIDPKKEPKHLDWKPAEAANKNRGVARCIYKIEGEKITIMFAPDGLPGGKRPTAFDKTKCDIFEGKRVVDAK